MSLETKYQAIKTVEAGKKLEIAAELGLKPNTLSTRLKQKGSIKVIYGRSNFVLATQKMRATVYGDVENTLDMWFHEAHAASFPISVSILHCSAEELTKKLGQPQFSTSSGWLYHFKIQHGYQWCTICGDAKSVSQEVVDSWKSGRLATFCQCILLKIFSILTRQAFSTRWSHPRAMC